MENLAQQKSTKTANLFTRFNIQLAKYGMYFSMTGLLIIIAIVAYQVFGRYVLNSSPTWAENLALVLILYVTLIGAAVGVRDAGHIGMESIIVLLPERIRNKIEMVIHICVALFGCAMVYNGCILAGSVAAYKLANINLSEAWRYVPLVLSGFLIILFSIEHLLALVSGTDVEPTWN